VVRLYESAGNLTNSNIDYEISRGCSFLHFAGHSVAPDPLLGIPKEYPWLLYKDFWGTHWLGWKEVYGWTNSPKLPVVISSACSSAKISVEECIGEVFICNPNGGAIAYFGPTGISPWNPYVLTGELMLRIYEAFTKGYTRLGEMWGVAISNYIQNNGINQELHERTIIEFILLGDPSLRIYNGPETLEVPEEYATIQGAINSAYSGDTIKVANGNYFEHIVINKTVSLVGESRYSTVIRGGGSGTVVYVLANNVNITGFTITEGEIGIKTDWRYSQNIKIIRSIIDNNAGGIQLYEVYNSTIADNQISNNNNWGMLLINNFPRFSNNTIINNTIWCNGYGIWIDNSGGNIVYHNIFTDNVQQVLIEWGNNTWDDSYPSGGNYWSDYTGVDANGDGIGDIPYVIDENNTDRYPLMNPWGSGTPVASFNWTPSTPEVGKLVTFDALASMPIAGEIVSYEWDFGDGSHATGDIVTHAYGSAGNYTVTLNVTDSEGLWDIEQKQIEVKTPPPPLTVSISPLSASILVGQSVIFTSTVTGGYPPYSYQWHLNGAPASNATADTWTFKPTESGIYYIYLKVTDAKDNTVQSETARLVVVSPTVGGRITPIEPFIAPTARPTTIPLTLTLLIVLTVILITIKSKVKKHQNNLFQIT